MSSLSDVMGALPDFRASLLTAQYSLTQKQLQSASKFGIRSLGRIDVHPLRNVHATGIGVRRKRGKLQPKDFAIKVFVFHKVKPIAKSYLGPLHKQFGGIDIDVEELPVARARGGNGNGFATTRIRPIIGGVQISARGTDRAGTLGCFVKRSGESGDTYFALSNNHVLAATDQLPPGADITQPATDNQADVFARLTNALPLDLPTAGDATQGTRQFDAAIAAVLDVNSITPGQISGIRYQPTLKAPAAYMSVTKSGSRGITNGVITTIGALPLSVNYGTTRNPTYAQFSGVITIQGKDNNGNDVPFSKDGDSGSIIVETATGQPVALLFGIAGGLSCACDLTALCTELKVLPA
jgi:hypothetical protein